MPEPKISLVEILPGLPSVIVKRSTSGTASPASMGMVRAGAKKTGSLVRAVS